jgi:hypothetical protein
MIFEALDDETATRRGSRRARVARTFRVWMEEEYKEIIASLP